MTKIASATLLDCWFRKDRVVAWYCRFRPISQGEQLNQANPMSPFAVIIVKTKRTSSSAQGPFPPPHKPLIRVDIPPFGFLSSYPSSVILILLFLKLHPIHDSKSCGGRSCRYVWRYLFRPRMSYLWSLLENSRRVSRQVRCVSALSRRVRGMRSRQQHLSAK